MANARAWKIWVPLGIIGLASGGGWYAWNQTGLAQYGSRLEENLLRASKLGIAITPEEVRQRTNVEDGNAAPAYRAILTQVRSQLGETSFSKLRDKERNGLTSEEWKQVEQTLTKEKPLLDRLVAASKKPGLDFDRAWELGPSLPLPEYADMRTGAKALLLRSGLNARKGKYQEALDDIEVAIRIGHHSGEEPILIAKLVEISHYNLALVRLQQIVDDAPTRPVLERSLKIVDSMRIPDIRPVIDGEMMMVRVSFNILAKDTRALSGFVSDDDPAVAALRFRSVRRAAEARCVEVYTKLYQDLPANPNNVRQVYEATTNFDQEAAKDDLVNRYSGWLLPTLSNTGDSVMMLASRKEAAKTALNLLLENGPNNLPANLSNATKDPRTQNPLIYQRSAKGFVIYIGERARDINEVRGKKMKGQPDNTDVGWAFRASELKL